ncbi:MAG: hypothetical protein QNL12_05390 [Acidimicrobiia bacterium]|nr:hypothetical protein [Acidimicrobiia bacterium]MDX2466726.1 hypothetical protein [Acidimicrobiia bacterium]
MKKYDGIASNLDLTLDSVLVEKSFEFLLERESNTSILSSFELPVIDRYFPEYETTITKMLAAED